MSGFRHMPEGAVQARSPAGPASTYRYSYNMSHIAFPLLQCTTGGTGAAGPPQCSPSAG